MFFCPKNHYKPHPGLTICPDGFIQLMSVDPNLVIHPAQLLRYLDHNEAVQKHQATKELVMPAGYEEWATVYNASKGNNPCEFVTFNLTTGLAFTTDGNIIEHGWANVKNALLCPYQEAVCNQACSDAHKAKCVLKKLCISDGPFRGYSSLFQHKAKVALACVPSLPITSPLVMASFGLKLIPVNQFQSPQSPLA
ncbi:hypothetical protein C0993_007885 [Termitomyces sp. T159_Od127]|nr:hypothetical protein C0993_007885 [Termitomyces sp. T159_Od127]